ncbi:probable disease resistance RPP8-like protein 4 [Macadamia integrifolia]|uniref:probable disease resistance RPP8-like protein 4 n=1 Tax=Macadamia integrifolia TaxID=60698 RepID=UPI001C4FA6F8|nr:probable disease resistance RPP8-like protein 4 [Macadamia integrifolia]
MAEGAIISFAQRLGVIVLEEYKFIQGVQDQVVSLRDELQWISSFLKDAAMQGNKNERVDIWVSQIRDLAYDAEDVLDVFILKVKRLRRRNIKALIHYPSQLFTLHKLGNKIDRINRRIDRISTYRSKYAIDKLEDKESLGKDVALNERTPPDMVEDGVVGFENQAKVVVQMLLLNQEDSQMHHVVSIVGMPGSGKTTLAHEVFDDVKYQFDSCAWVNVSPKYTLVSPLQSIKSQNPGKEGGMGNLLVVFDDVRKRKDWEALYSDVLKNIKSTKIRILLTSRFGKVTKRANSSLDPYEIRPLEKKDSLELLKRKVFPKQSCFPEQLKDLAEKIVEKCEGLPLAIVVMGGLLSRKQKTAEVWNKILQNSRWQLIHGSTTEWLELPSLSYDNLPNFLKPCFLYFGLFPEDCPVDCEILIQLWIAEGFIEEKGAETMEDVAENYLEELIQRNMIQVACRRFDGSLETCRIHDLFREFAILKGQQDKFLDVLGSKGSANRTMSRRLAIHSTYEAAKVTEIPNSSSLNNPRSIMYFNCSRNVRLEEKFFHKSFKLLRVLDLRGVSPRILPDEIGKLVLLKYLNLHGAKIGRLPSSIRNLRNLLTLDISYTQINGIPWSVWELEELRNFYANLLYSTHQESNSSDAGNDGFSSNVGCNIRDYYHSGDTPKIGRLRNLRTLSTRGDNWICNDFGQLSNLRKLKITEVNMDLYGEALSNSFFQFIFLKELDIDWNKGMLQFPDSLSQHIYLYKLRLSGVMIKLPSDPSFFPPNLAELHLCRTDLKEEDGFS